MGIQTLPSTSLFSDSESSLTLIDDANPRYQQRLTDKILAAFTHSYALDEIELATELWAALELAERVSERENSRRVPNQALRLAQYWIKLVDAKRRYHDAMSIAGGREGEADQALQEMKAAYQAWQVQFDEE